MAKEPMNMHKRMAISGIPQGNKLKAGGMPKKGVTEHHVHVMHDTSKPNEKHKINVHHHYCAGGKVMNSERKDG